MDLRAEGFGASGPAVRSVPIGPACEAGEAGGEIVVQGTHEDVGFTPDHPRTHPGPGPGPPRTTFPVLVYGTGPPALPNFCSRQRLASVCC